MQRAKGKVPTRKNPEMVATGSENIEAKKDWGKNSARILERRKEGKPIPMTAERRLLEKPKPIQEKILDKAKTKNIEKDEPGN